MRWRVGALSPVSVGSFRTLRVTAPIFHSTIPLVHWLSEREFGLRLRILDNLINELSAWMIESN